VSWAIGIAVVGSGPRDDGDDDIGLTREKSPRPLRRGEGATRSGRGAGSLRGLGNPK
jgi:hypothetical protein